MNDCDVYLKKQHNCKPLNKIGLSIPFSVCHFLKTIDARNNSFYKIRKIDNTVIKPK